MRLIKTTQQNAATAEELVATTREMGGKPVQLQYLMEFFRIEEQRVA